MSETQDPTPASVAAATKHPVSNDSTDSLPYGIVADYEVRDRTRHIQFKGALLSYVTSERPNSPRWTEMALYRTERGMYVISTIGMSLVFHTADCKQANANRLSFGHELRGDDKAHIIMQNLSPCPRCSPSRNDPFETLRFEKERHWAGIAETADAVVEQLYRDENGVRSLPWIASVLLDRASSQDDDLRRAYMTETII